ncbi:murein transglycosylase domain-containing protein [Hydrogenovibrio thermophilus]|uniref:DUF3393 domain-containing protein n=1 Tax=Hydrogenovibrio thermophilus TaxID=265883 RepID=A0A410H3W2_9GAMM|nr:murein transglycosylase domain-containing protein [Hydrogenovibrio thermophilus]QAB15587.1 DUF3393 domain-containing protein [Hydrogenovibrio thermophilus]
MSLPKIFFHLMFAIMMLGVVSSGVMTAFQHWVLSQSQASVPAKTPVIVESGIRHMISSNPKALPTSFEPEDRFEDAENTSAPKFEIQPDDSKPAFSSERPQPAFVKTTPSPSSESLEKAAETSSAKASPVLVVYENELVLEFPKAIASTQNIKNAVSRVLLLDRPTAGHELLSREKMNLRKRPYFYRRVLDQNQNPVRYPKQAFDYADYLMEHEVEELSDEEGDFIALHIPLHESGLSGPAKNYQAWVKTYASEFGVPESLIYAVMETESAFNPKAVSRSNAIGLMQVKAEAAGKDVYQYIDAKPGQPSLDELFDSEKNIRMGTAYLGLLKHDYLSDILDDKIKQMVTISSYNGGIKTVLGLFGKTPEAAIKRLNHMKPNQVYRKLRYDHHSDETRRYLDKVMKAETKYRELLQET